MGPAETGAFLGTYRASARSVYSNEIFLSADEAAELDRLVRENFQPNNRDYVYDYFDDNCSTRVRDLLDTVLGGVLFDAFGSGETAASYRSHARRLVGESLWLDQGLSFLLGSRGDAPRNEWEAMFIPMELMREPRGVREAGNDRGPGSAPGPESGTRGQWPAGRADCTPWILPVVALRRPGRRRVPPRRGTRGGPGKRDGAPDPRHDHRRVGHLRGPPRHAPPERLVHGSRFHRMERQPPSPEPARPHPGGPPRCGVVAGRVGARSGRPDGCVPRACDHAPLRRGRRSRTPLCLFPGKRRGGRRRPPGECGRGGRPPHGHAAPEG